VTTLRKNFRISGSAQTSGNSIFERQAIAGSWLMENNAGNSREKMYEFWND
jgi:hypothetical protein